MSLIFKTESDGDTRCYSGGLYVGMICPHHGPEYLHVIADGGDFYDLQPDLESAKASLVKYVEFCEAKSKWELAYCDA